MLEYLNEWVTGSYKTWYYSGYVRQPLDFAQDKENTSFWGQTDRQATYW